MKGGWGEAQVAASRQIYIHNNARQMGKSSYCNRLCALIFQCLAFLEGLIARSFIAVWMKSGDFTWGRFARVSLLALKNGVTSEIKPSRIEGIPSCGD